MLSELMVKMPGEGMYYLDIISLKSIREEKRGLFGLDFDLI